MEKSHLENTNVELLGKIEDAKNTNDKLVATTGELSSELKAAKDHRYQMENNFLLVEKSRSEASVERDEAVAALAEVKSTLADTKVTVGTMNDEIKRQTSEIDSLKQDLLNRSSRLEDLETEVAEKSRLISQLQSEKEQIQSDLDKSEYEFGLSKASSEQLTLRTEELEAQLVEFETSFLKEKGDLRLTSVDCRQTMIHSRSIFRVAILGLRTSKLR